MFNCRKKISIYFFIALAATSATATPNNAVILSDIESKTVISRGIKVGEKVFQSTFYSRMASGDFRHINNADYIQLWHGKDQTPYSFLNLSNLAGVNEGNIRRLMFFGVEQETYTRDESVTLTRLTTMVRLPYKKIVKPRQEISIGYDLGVASAFVYSCLTKTPSVFLSAGGLFEDESCKPTGTKVVYSINSGDKLFLWNKDLAFVSNQSYSLDNRLDGIQSVEKLKKLMGCSGDALTPKGYGATLERYICQNTNELFVIKNNTNDHQWNGYINVSEGNFNQYGASYKVSLTNWINQEFDVR